MRGQEEGLNTIVINPSVILGTGDWNKSSSKIFKYIWKERPFYIDGHVNFVSLNDVVNVVEQLLNSPMMGERFIVSAGIVSYNELFGLIAKNFGKKNPVIKIKGKLISLLAWLSTAAANLTGTDPLITKEMARATAHSVLFDNSKVKSMLNLQFEPLDKTLEICCQHYKTLAEG
jgi:nucleoside-diphosphate-sugar epimerase